MSPYKLVYFDGRGRAETIRLAFVAGGIKYEDVRLSKAEWLALKPKTFSWKIPYLEVDGKVLIESLAIARFVAKKGGLMGETSFEEATVDSVVEVVNNCYLKFIELKYVPEDKKDEKRREYVEKQLNYAAEVLEKFLGNKKYFVTNELTLADLHFFTIFDFLSVFQWDKTYPLLKLHHDRIAQHPRISAYLKARPESEF